jgi:hypothetical protein
VLESGPDSAPPGLAPWRWNAAAAAVFVAALGITFGDLWRDDPRSALDLLAPAPGRGDAARLPRMEIRPPPEILDFFARLEDAGLLETEVASAFAIEVDAGPPDRERREAGTAG